jgi:hypothetical protein
MNILSFFLPVLLWIKILVRHSDYFFLLSFPQTNAELYKYLSVGIRQMTRGKFHKTNYFKLFWYIHFSLITCLYNFLTCTRNDMGFQPHSMFYGNYEGFQQIWHFILFI